MALTRAEAGRKATHVAAGSFALLLRWMTWEQAAALALAAFLFNWQVLPRLGGRALWREGEHERGYPPGILLYPLAVLGLVLAFRHHLWAAAAVWGVLAWGDGMATLAGQGLGGPRLPWNAGKTWIGLTACALFGAAAAALLIVWTARLPARDLCSPWIVGVSVLLALACAAVESLPIPVDDNVTVPLTGGLMMAAVVHVQDGFDAGADIGARLAAGVAVNAAIAALAWRARALDAGGAVSTALIGTAVTVSLGWPGLAVLAAFFLAGTAATRLGFRRKAHLGLAEEKGGARGWRNAWANGAVPAALAVLAPFAPGASQATWVLAYAASVATAAADTCSSEIGKAAGRRTVLVTTLAPVPPGTEGGVSLAGTVGGLCGAMLVAGVGAASGLHAWSAAALVAVAGFLGSVGESVLGALSARRGAVSGHLLNVVNTALGAALAAAFAWAAR
jgi:uncharacterized protein (TIGR00297 family)